MASLNKKFIMMGVSTILIPIGKFVIKRIVKKGLKKFDSQSSEEEKGNLVSAG